MGKKKGFDFGRALLAVGTGGISEGVRFATQPGGPFGPAPKAPYPAPVPPPSAEVMGASYIGPPRTEGLTAAEAATLGLFQSPTTAFGAQNQLGGIYAGTPGERQVFGGQVGGPLPTVAQTMAGQAPQMFGAIQAPQAPAARAPVMGQPYGQVSRPDLSHGTLSPGMQQTIGQSIRGLARPALAGPGGPLAVGPRPTGPMPQPMPLPMFSPIQAQLADLQSRRFAAPKKIKSTKTRSR